MITLILNNIFVLFCIFSPVFSLFIVKFYFFNCWRWFIVCEAFFLFLGVFILFFYSGIDAHTLPSMLMFYPLSIVLFNYVFTVRFGVEKFAKVLSLSLMLGFILTELHEFPVFVFSIFGLYGHGWSFVWFLPQIYLGIVGYLAAKLGGLKRSWKPIVFFSFCLVSLFLFYFVEPLVDIAHPPSLLAYLKRVFCFSFLTVLFTFWGDIDGD